MKNMQEVLLEAKAGHYAVPAFNIVDFTSARAVIRAGEEMNSPIILQTSTGTVRYYGAAVLCQMLSELRHQAKVQTFLHLDHCTAIELAKECVDAGWDSIMFDGSKLAYEDNIAQTKAVVEYSHNKGVCVEGELGTIQGVEEDVSSAASELASYNDCIDFVQRSGIDCFAPAIGTAHGVYNGKPVLQFDLVKQLSDTIPEPIVIHGGTGLSDEDFHRLVANGAAKINISTALKIAYFRGIEGYQASGGPVNPLGAEKAIESEIREMALTHIQRFRL